MRESLSILSTDLPVFQPISEWGGSRPEAKSFERTGWFDSFDRIFRDNVSFELIKFKSFEFK